MDEEDTAADDRVVVRVDGVLLLDDTGADSVRHCEEFNHGLHTINGVHDAGVSGCTGPL